MLHCFTKLQIITVKIAYYNKPCSQPYMCDKDPYSNDEFPFFPYLNLFIIWNWR